MYGVKKPFTAAGKSGTMSHRLHETIRKGLEVKLRTHHEAWLIAGLFLVLFSGCATVEPPVSQARRFFDILNRYPKTTEPLKLRQLTVASPLAPPVAAAQPDVFIMVHPAYSLFFRDANKAPRYPAAKYELLSRQFDDEARFMSEVARSGNILVLIIPGRYLEESDAPLSYTTYLNTTVSAGDAVYYLYSDSPSNGTIAMNDMVDLYRFLQVVKAGKVLVGGGYIGRCQREFYNELTTYFEKSITYIVPEISTISPEDITESEAVSILSGIERRDYGPVRQFIDKKLDRNANVLSLPHKQEM